MERGKQPLRDVRVLRCLAGALRIPPLLLGLADTPLRSVRAPRPVVRVGFTLAPDEESDPMRRRTLLAGLTSLAGTATARSRRQARRRFRLVGAELEHGRDPCGMRSQCLSREVVLKSR